MKLSKFIWQKVFNTWNRPNETHLTENKQQLDSTLELFTNKAINRSPYDLVDRTHDKSHERNYSKNSTDTNCDLSIFNFIIHIATV